MGPTETNFSDICQCQQQIFVYVLFHFNRAWLNKIYSRKHKNIFVFSITSWHWDGWGIWNYSSPWKTPMNPYYRSIPWHPMAWRRKEPGHQQPQCWPHSQRIFEPRDQEGYKFTTNNRKFASLTIFVWNRSVIGFLIPYISLNMVWWAQGIICG